MTSLCVSSIFTVRRKGFPIRPVLEDTGENQTKPNQNDDGDFITSVVSNRER